MNRPAPRRAALALLLVTALGCERLDTFSLDPDAGPSDSAADAGSTGPSATFVPVDILMIVDDSVSMGDEQSNLAASFAAFADQTIGVVDYRLAIVSTSQNAPFERTGLAETTFSSTAPYHPLTGVSLEQCRTTTIAAGCFRTRDAARPVVDSARMDRSAQLAAFEANVRVGTCGDGQERAFDALLSALRQMRPTGCNAGFLREDANLVVLFVSDEDDDSQLAVDDYVTELARYKDYAKIRVGVIGGAVGGQPARCGADGTAACGSLCETRPPAGSQAPCVVGEPDACPASEHCRALTAGSQQGACEDQALQLWGADTCASCAFYAAPDCCTALAATRYVDFARKVEARVHAARPELPIEGCVGLGTRVACLVDSICQTSFGDTLARIARELVVPR